MGLHPMTVFRLESGQRNLDVAELIDIARILEVDPRELFGAALSDGAT
jgi:transcriptional regulator with XRE-family HTH domain